MPDPQTRPRLTPLPETDWDNRTRELLQGFPRKLNIFTTLARHPGLLKRWLVFGGHVLRKNTLPARERELLILRTGWLCQSDYEFHQHTALGLSCGLTEAEVRRCTKDASAWSGNDATLIQAADQLVERKRISDETWAELQTRFNERQLIDIVFTVGQYTLASMALNTLGVQIEDGSSGFPS